MLATGIVLAALALTPGPVGDQVVVAAEPSVDAQRLADALRVYLNEYGIRVEAHATTGVADLRGRLDQARNLGEAVRAVAVVRIASAAGASAIELELVDLATDKALLVTVPRPARDEDLYRALALKIQAVLRATLSEARAELAPESSLGRLVAAQASPRPAELGTRLALDVGVDVLAFPLGGPSFSGLGARASWRPSPRLDLSLATAALGAERASVGTVDATATVIPVRAAVRMPLPLGSSGTSRLSVLVGACLGVTHVRVTATSAETPVRSTRTLMVALGAEAEARVSLVRGVWLFARGAAMGVLNGERYSAAGAPLLDTSRLQLAGAFGAGVGLP